MRIWIGIIFVRFVFVNYSRIPKIVLALNFSISNFFFLIFIYFQLKNIPGKQSHSELYAFSLCIFNIKIRYSRILNSMFVNRYYIHQITIFANRNNIHEMKLCQIGLAIYLWPEYQQIDLWQIYSQAIYELFANTELFPEHWILE